MVVLRGRGEGEVEGLVIGLFKGQVEGVGYGSEDEDIEEVDCKGEENHKNGSFFLSEHNMKTEGLGKENQGIRINKDPPEIYHLFKIRYV